jgi:hypothetical protein
MKSSREKGRNGRRRAVGDRAEGLGTTDRPEARGPRIPDDRKYKKRRSVMKRPNKVGRDSITGQFIPVNTAHDRPATTTVETLKKK